MKYLFVLLFVGCVRYQPVIQEPVQCKEFEPYKRNKCISDCKLEDEKLCYDLCQDLYPYSCK